MNITEKKRLMEWRGGRERHTASTLTCVPVSGSPSSPFSLLISFRGEFPAPGPKTEARDFPLAPPQRKRELKKKVGGLTWGWKDEDRKTVIFCLASLQSQSFGLRQKLMFSLLGWRREMGDLHWRK